jgi:hypothetical protein
MKVQHAEADVKKHTRLAMAKMPAKRKIVQDAAHHARQGTISNRPKMAMAEPGHG